jgi:hypothetical protein
MSKTTFASLGLPLDREMSMIFESDLRIAATAEIKRKGQVFGLTAETRAATNWQFAGPAVDVIEDGTLRTEDVFLMNPTGDAISVKVRFTFSNGEVVEQTLVLDSLEVKSIDAEIFVGNEDVTFGVTVISDAFSVAMLEHFETLDDNGFAVAGIASGEIEPLHAVL